MAWSSKPHPLLAAYDQYVRHHNSSALTRSNPWAEHLDWLFVGSKNPPLANPAFRAVVEAQILALSHTKCLDSANLTDTLSAIIRVGEYRDQWVRQPSSYIPISYNPLKCLRGYVQHCMFKYPLSSMWLDLWFKKAYPKTEWEKRAITWSLQLGSGVSAKKLDLPVPMTSLERHHFITTKEYPVSEALRVAQMKALKFSTPLIEEILRSPIGDVFRYISIDSSREPFIKEFLLFISNQNMLSVENARPILDYVLNQRQQDRSYSLKGRTATSILRSVEAWHAAINKSKTGAHVSWPGQKGHLPYDAQVQGGLLSITELTSNKALLKEGNSMHHCVYSYAPSCISNACAIFSLRIEGKSYATIELRLPQKMVVQVRGSCNSKVDSVIKNHILAWANQNNYVYNAL
jgi:PcfJ-like protein